VAANNRAHGYLFAVKALSYKEKWQTALGRFHPMRVGLSQEAITGLARIYFRMTLGNQSVSAGI
jgi:hypothetical protein